MNLCFRPVIGVATPDPKGVAAPAANCDQCAYFHPLFPDALQGTCVHAWSDHVGDLVFSHQSCEHCSDEHDPTLDTSCEQSWTVRR